MVKKQVGRPKDDARTYVLRKIFSSNVHGYKVIDLLECDKNDLMRRFGIQNGLDAVARIAKIVDLHIPDDYVTDAMDVNEHQLTAVNDTTEEPGIMDWD